MKKSAEWAEAGSGARVHQTAVVDKAAELGEGVEIGPYSVIGPFVRLGAGTRVASHAVVDGHTRLGDRCVVFPGACVGTQPQDKKFKGEKSYLVIGSENVIREHVTIHPGSLAESRTVIGDRNLLMVGVHVGHDCVIGNDVIISNSVGLAGHVCIEDQAVIGGMSGVHQFCRVGRLAMVGAMSKLSMDLAPYSIADGHPAHFFGVNSVGLKRAGFSSQDVLILKKALRTLFASQSNLSKAVREVEAEFKDHPEIRYLLDFVKTSERGVMRAVSKE